MPPSKSGKQDAKPFNRSGSNQFGNGKGKPFSRATARTARPAPLARPAGALAPTKTGTSVDDEQKILFQQFFKSVGPRTYASQIKQAKNGNYFIVLTEGKRDRETDEVRKTKILVFSEDFTQFFKLLSDTAKYLREHPVPDEVRAKRQRYWARKNDEPKAGANGNAVKPPPMPTQPRVRPAENKPRR